MIKIIFHLLNIIFVFLYIYPGSLLGFLIYKDISKQPQILPDLGVSSNHLFAFLLLSSLGFISYFKSLKKVILYLIFISIILELLHLYIPNRSFQFSDLFGNMLGVLLAFFVVKLLIYWRKR